MSINFATYAKEIQDAHRNVLDSNNSTNWAMFGYGPSNELKVTGSGDGGLEEIYDEFEGSKIQYGYCRVIEPGSGLPKFVLICWCGEGVPVSKKGLFHGHVNEITNYFKGFHVQINARCEEDIDPKVILQRVKDSSGAKYSIQSNVANPSLAKPVSKPGAFVPPKPTIQPKPAQQATPVEPPKVHRQVQPPVAQQPAPKQFVSQPVPKEEPKPLFSSSTSTYQPIKTNPKPLNNPFVEQTPPQPEEPRRSVGKVSQLASAFQQPQEPVTSSYQPIKTSPKPLYDTGVAKMAYQPVDTPRRSINENLRPSEIQRRQEQKLREQQERERVEMEKLAQLKLEESKNARAEMEKRAEEARKREMALEQERLDRERKAQEQQRRMEEQRRQQELQKQKEAERQQELQRQEELQRQQQLERQQQTQQPKGLTVVALYDYSPDDAAEIALREGEVLTDVKETAEEGWWEGTNASGQRGLFPGTYVEVQSAPQPVPTYQAAPLPVQIPVQQPIPQPTKPNSRSAVAIYDYEAAEDNEVSFMTDDVITEIDFVSDDWWSGTVRGKTGLFPGNYVELK